MTTNWSSPVTTADRIAAYLADAPMDGGHSDAAGASSWELLEDAMHELRAGVAQTPAWQPINTAPKDGSWIIAICNDHSRLYRMSWGRARDGEMWWCTATNSYGEGLFNCGGGWIPCPPSVTSTHQASDSWIDQNHQIDRYGVALMMIREGCADPSGLARRILSEFDSSSVSQETSAHD